MIECRSRDEDYCYEFGFEIKEDNPCKICPYIEKPKKETKLDGIIIAPFIEEEKDG